MTYSRENLISKYWRVIVKMNVYLILMVAISCLFVAASCAQKTLDAEHQVQALERDWIIEKDILVDFVKPKTSNFASIQVYRRNPKSQSRMINFGSFPKIKMRMKAWLVPQEKLSNVLNDQQFSFASLLQNPSQIESLSDQIDTIGQSIGDVKNSGKYGDGHFYSDKSAKFFGGGTVPRISEIPDPINQDYRVVVMIESQPKAKNEKPNEEISYGRSYFYTTNSAIHIIKGYEKITANKKPYFNYSNRNRLDQKVVDEKPSLSANKTTIGVNKVSVPYDHHIAIGWKK